jgi:hypothetical protein
MASMSPVCDGLISVDVLGNLHCSVAWSAINTPMTFDFAQIDPVVMGEAVAAGFILSYGLTALAWGGRILITSIWKGFK